MGQTRTQPDIVIDRARREVDCSGPVWRLNIATLPVVLHWESVQRLPEFIKWAAKAYVRYRITTWSSLSVGTLFRMFQLLDRCDSAVHSTSFLPTRAYEELRQLPSVFETHLARFRQWYRWCTNRRFDGFSPAVLDELNQIVIGGHARGEWDENERPLTDAERQLLLNRTLLASDEDLPLRERVAVLLSVMTGANSGPLTLLQTRDFLERSEGGRTYYLLRIPRHKKGHESERAAFRTRAIDSQIATLIKRLIERNHRDANELFRTSYNQAWSPEVAVPMFMRDQPRRDLTPEMGEYALHLTTGELRALLKDAVSRLEITLHLTPRRLRVTFANNLLANGYTAEEVADALDHSSTAPIKHYTDQNAGLFEALNDSGLGQVLARTVGEYLGTLTSQSKEAARGRVSASRIRYFNAEHQEPRTLGNCGGGSGCELAAPLACYTCPYFEPCIDGDHAGFLGQLLSARKQRNAAGLHPRLVAVQDVTIEAVAEVVRAVSTRGPDGEDTQ